MSQQAKPGAIPVGGKPERKMKMFKIIRVYQTDAGTRVEYENGSWTVEDPVTCVMHVATGRVFFFATENRGERIAKAAFMTYGQGLAETHIREFPENEFVAIVGWALGALVRVLGGWKEIWESFETVLFPV